MVIVFPYWVTIVGREPGCVFAGTPEGAKEKTMEVLGIRYNSIISVRPLPYKASPVIWEPLDGVVRPDFCYRPSQCSEAGRCTAYLSCLD